MAHDRAGCPLAAGAPHHLPLGERGYPIRTAPAPQRRLATGCTRSRLGRVWLGVERPWSTAPGLCSWCWASPARPRRRLGAGSRDQDSSPGSAPGRTPKSRYRALGCSTSPRCDRVSSQRPARSLPTSAARSALTAEPAPSEGRGAETQCLGTGVSPPSDIASPASHRRG